VEAFNASFTPRLRAVKLGAAGADYNQAVVSPTFNTELPAARITQVYTFTPATAQQGHTSTQAGLAGQTLSLTVVPATTLPEVARWQIDAKPIGQWTVGTDVIADTASTLFPVILQQNILDFEVSNATQGHTVEAPTGNTNLVQGAANATQGHTATPVVFTQSHVVVAVEATHGHTVAAPGISQPSATMGVDGPNTMGIEVAAPALGGLQLMSVAVAEMGAEVAAPPLFVVPGVPTPAERVFTPANENRVYEVVTESRSFAIAA
jgi:hypothetical protein